MTIYEETRRIDCENAVGRRLVVIEQRKWLSIAPGAQVRVPVFDYMTEDGQIANRLDDENFLLLMTDEVFHRA
ncbi:hypothetical protein [Rhizobium sp. RAF56]|jgi:hypothetical protein|uniref:hypothetical protein n=1 Tax=Rhizobium sp. RAF56 TaxID=3233062 RepID=UPI003F972756